MVPRLPGFAPVPTDELPAAAVQPGEAAAFRRSVVRIHVGLTVLRFERATVPRRLQPASDSAQQRYDLHNHSVGHHLRHYKDSRPDQREVRRQGIEGDIPDAASPGTAHSVDMKVLLVIASVLVCIIVVAAAPRGKAIPTRA